MPTRLSDNSAIAWVFQLIACSGSMPAARYVHRSTGCSIRIGHGGSPFAMRTMYCPSGLTCRVSTAAKSAICGRRACPSILPLRPSVRPRFMCSLQRSGCQTDRESRATGVNNASICRLASDSARRVACVIAPRRADADSIRYSGSLANVSGNWPERRVACFHSARRADGRSTVLRDTRVARRLAASS